MRQSTNQSISQSLFESILSLFFILNLLYKIILYFNTIKYLRPVQIYGRILSTIKRKLNLIKIPTIPDKLKPLLEPKTDFIFHDPWSKRNELLNGNFIFLNKTFSLGFPPKWDDCESSLLWQFNLHYFNFLFLLNQEEQIRICQAWIDNNFFKNKVNWHPFVISLRIVNWCKLKSEDEKINKSIYQQASYLYRNLEYYHPANHYLENAKALIFAGLYFENQGEANKWFEKGLEIYLKETPKQVFEDGGYFEKSIMYHAIMLEGYLDILNIIPSDHAYYNYFKDTAKRMLNFLIDSTHPDGNIALFNDSTQEIAPSTNEIIDYANRLNIVCDQSTNQPYHHHSFIL